MRATLSRWAGFVLYKQGQKRLYILTSNFFLHQKS